jgi:hypothetical protein
MSPMNRQPSGLDTEAQRLGKSETALAGEAAAANRPAIKPKSTLLMTLSQEETVFSNNELKTDKQRVRLDLLPLW